MTELYTRRETERFRRLALCSGVLAAAALAAALAVCVLLCCRVRTLNAARLEKTVILVSVLSGWFALLLYFMVCRPARAEYRHMAGIRQGEKTEHSGVLTVSPAELTLPRSITVRKVTLSGDEGELALTLNARLARRMPPNGSRVRVSAVRKYITAFEVLP